jgi:hypothetical protein
MPISATPEIEEEYHPKNGEDVLDFIDPVDDVDPRKCLTRGGKRVDKAVRC